MTHYSVDFTRRLLREANVSEGKRVLDVGCGLGDVAFLAASLVGSSGAVIGIDRNDKVLAIARQRIADPAGVMPTFIQAGIETLPDSIGAFDVIVGRRVLMYQPDAERAVRLLAERLVPGGVMAFQEADLTMVPASIVPMPLHERATGWLRAMLEREGADLHMGFHLHKVLTDAGLTVEGVRAEAIVQTPTDPSPLGGIIQAAWPRIAEHGIATAADIDAGTIQARLDDERKTTNAIYIGDMMFAAWAHR